MNRDGTNLDFTAPPPPVSVETAQMGFWKMRGKANLGLEPLEPSSLAKLD